MASRRQRQLGLLKVLAAAAWADGKLEPEEVNRIKELMLTSDLEPAEVNEIYDLLNAPVSYERCEALTRDLMGMLGSRREREEALRELETLLRADGTLDEDEREVLEGLKGIMDAMNSVDGFMARITSVFRRVLPPRDLSRDPGELTQYLKNAVLRRTDDLSQGRWRETLDAASLNRYTLFGAILGRVADVEDGISQEELDRIRALLAERFSLKPPILDWVVQAVREASSAKMDRQGLLSEFNRIADMDQRLELLDAAFAVAAADGVIGPEELTELRLLSNFLWVDRRDFAKVHARWKSAVR